MRVAVCTSTEILVENIQLTSVLIFVGSLDISLVGNKCFATERRETHKKHTYTFQDLHILNNLCKQLYIKLV